MDDICKIDGLSCRRSTLDEILADVSKMETIQPGDGFGLKIRTMTPMEIADALIALKEHDKQGGED